MAVSPEIVTAQDLDAMTSNERAKAFEDHLVRDLDDLPVEFRVRVEAAGRRLAAELHPTSTE